VLLEYLLVEDVLPSMHLWRMCFSNVLLEYALFAVCASGVRTSGVCASGVVLLEYVLVEDVLPEYVPLE